LYNLLISNTRIARPDGTSFEGNIACEDGSIARMDSNISAPAHETIDAGKLLLPGVIDPQGHFRGPGSEYKEDLGTDGGDADLTLVDIDYARPVRKEETFTKIGWSPWHDRELYGWPQATIVNGAIAFENGKIHEQTRGRPLTSPDYE